MERRAERTLFRERRGTSPISMSEILKMDIFFFISSIGTVLMLCAIVYILYQLSTLLKYAIYIVKEVGDEAHLVREDISSLRADVKEGKHVVLSTLMYLAGIKRKGKRSDTKK